jgi:Zn-dependent protease
MMNGDFNSPPVQPARATRYFRMESRKVTYGEYWNIVRSWKVLIPWGAKLLNVPLKFTGALAYFDSVRDLKITEADFPPRAREKLQGMWDECQRLGFHSPQFHTYVSMNGDTSVSFISLLHPSGATLRLMYTESTKVHPPKVQIQVVLLSQLRDGTFFFTTGERPKFLAAPGIVANRLVGASPEQLVQAHLAKMDTCKLSNPARPVESTEALDELWDRYETLARDFGMKRGLYVWMTPEEVAAEQGQLAAAKAMAGPTTENTGVLLELNKLLNQKTGWGSVVMLLLISLALFVGTSSRQWSWNYVLILVPVLFFHELGHYVAMRAFNYRNLRMFFIPFFGAAVMGRHYNVPGWKKVLVSLMGPVPGILLGVIIGCAGLIFHQPLLVRVALITLILNGFNLLPVLPFDGGWVFHTLLFSRHYALDSAFRVLAALALLAGGMLSHSKLLMFLSIPMFISIPATHRTARIATRLRERGIPPASADDQTVPPETAEAIIKELKQSNRNLTSDKMLAQQTLQIFETLNARPPGWAATIGLLFGHFTSLAMAVVFSLVLIVGQRGDLHAALANLKRLPKHALECGVARTWRGPQVEEKLALGHDIIVATFPGRAKTERAFEGLTGRLPANAALKTFGESLFVVLPADADAARKEWVRELQQQTKDVFVDTTNFEATVSLTCVAPDNKTAAALFDELEGHFSTLPYKGLVPPWFPQDPRSALERARQDLARQTYLTLERRQLENLNEGEQSALEKRITVARTQGDKAEVKALVKRMEQLAQQTRTRNLERARQGEYGPVDTNLVALFIAAAAEEPGTNGAHARLVDQMAQRMGQLPLAQGQPTPEAAAFLTRSGMVSRDKLQIRLMWVSFRSLADGAPALVQWLCDKGCGDFKYEFHPGTGFGDVEAE